MLKNSQITYFPWSVTLVFWTIARLGNPTLRAIPQGWDKLQIPERRKSTCRDVFKLRKKKKTEGVQVCPVMVWLWSHRGAFVRQRWVVRNGKDNWLHITSFRFSTRYNYHRGQTSIRCVEMSGVLQNGSVQHFTVYMVVKPKSWGTSVGGTRPRPVRSTWKVERTFIVGVFPLFAKWLGSWQPPPLLPPGLRARSLY